MNQQQIGLIDCNNFFVSCERLFRPDLVGRPVVVLSSNDGCVVARSQEIKDIGIPMGVPYFQIKDMLDTAGATVFSGHIAMYRDISRRVFEVVRQELDTVEQYSVDEAFFVVPQGSSTHQLIATLKQRVEQLTGIPISIGVGASKTQAKFASTVAKKTGGLFVCDADQWGSLTAEIRLEQIWGVGAGLARKFTAQGITTVAELLATDTNRVQVCFGVVGVRLQAELGGIAVSPVEPKRLLQKSLINSRSFSKTTQDSSILADAAAYHARQIATELRLMGAVCSAVRLALSTSRHGDFFLRGGSLERVFDTPTSDTFVLVAAAEELLQGLFEAGVPYQKVGVSVTGISLQQPASATLFGEPVADRSALLLALDKLNARSGRELITVGSRLRTSQWQSKSEARSPAYTTRWNELATVSA